MAALPDSFDLWVRRARELSDGRGEEWLLGALFSQPEWFFLNQGGEGNPSPALAEIGGQLHLIVFSGIEKLRDAVESSLGERAEATPHFSVPTVSATEYSLQFRAAGVVALLVNPGDYAFSIALEKAERFNAEWQARRNSGASGFLIPEMTSEEEDFWQSHGL